MNKEKIYLLKDKIRQNKKLLFIITAILWGAYTIFILNLLRLPAEITQEINENNITQETNFSYKADIIPFALNPEGGVTDFEQSTFTKVTNDIILHISSVVKSDKPISIKGTKKVVLKLIAGELWEKEYVLSPEASFQIEGSNNKIIDEDYDIDISGLLEFIKVVEEQIDTRAGDYSFEIKPIITGTVVFNGKEIPIDLESKTIIDYSDRLIKVSEEKQFTKSTPIIDTVVIPQKYYILGRETSVVNDKYISGIIYLLFSALSIIVAIRYIRSKKSKLSEVQKIDKKHKFRLIKVMQQPNKKDSEKIILDSFRSLVTISDEKESPIFRYENLEKVVYYVMDNGYIFSYEVYSDIGSGLNSANNTFDTGKCYTSEG